MANTPPSSPRHLPSSPTNTSGADDEKKGTQPPQPIAQFKKQVEAAIAKFDAAADKDLIATMRQFEQDLIKDMNSLNEMRKACDSLSGSAKRAQEDAIAAQEKTMQEKTYTFQSTARSQANGAKPWVLAVIGAVVTAALTLIGCALGFFLTGTPAGAIPGAMLGSTVTKALTASALVAGGIFGYTRGRQNETVDNLASDSLTFIDTPRAQFSG